jgi:hypothetical protein
MFKTIVLATAIAIPLATSAVVTATPAAAQFTDSNGNFDGNAFQREGDQFRANQRMEQQQEQFFDQQRRAHEEWQQQQPAPGCRSYWAC